MDAPSRNPSRNTSNNLQLQTWMFVIAILLSGALLGYLFRGTSSPTASAGSLTSSQNIGSRPTSESRSSIETSVQPLLDRLKDTPNDPDLLTEIGDTYYDNHEYGKAVQYYQRLLKIRPGDVDVRTDMGTAIWYSGDADGAIREYHMSLRYQPNHPQTLFNMGVVEWQGKHHDNAALQWWQKLLSEAPGYPDREKVEHLVQQVQGEMARSAGTQAVR